MKRILAVFLIVSSSAMAHPGRLDSNGGHVEKATGVWHSHSSISVPARSPAIQSRYKPISSPQSAPAPAKEESKQFYALRPLVAKVGGAVEYYDKTKSIIVKKGASEVAFCVGNREISLNGQSITIAFAPILVVDRTMISEGLANIIMTMK